MLMSLNPRIRPSTARRVAAVCGTGVLLLGASACGSGDPDATGAQPQSSSEGGPGSSTQQNGRLPGADGKIAAVDGSTAQVQSRNDGQVAVTWNDSTTFTKQVSAALGDVEVGDCVMVQPTTADADADEESTQVDAASVQITAKVDGSCTGGLRGPGAGGPQQAPPGGTQDGGPQVDGQGPGDGSQPPQGARPQMRGFGAFGEVTAVTAKGFTVKATMPRFTEGSQTPSTEETTVTVLVSDATTYTTTGKATAADVKVGGCLRAEGAVDATGAVTATTVALTPATDGECGGMVFSRSGGPSGSTGSTSQES